MKNVLLVSNTVMHYRVSVYNYFWRGFRQEGYEFQVLTNKLQPQNKIPLQFQLQEIPFRFGMYRQAILERQPAAVILFLHLKDRMFWPLVHWLKWKKIPVAFWTKTRNLDQPDNPLRNMLFDYMLWIHDGLILYSADLMKNVPLGERDKAFPANNTINFEDFPEVNEGREEIKRQLGIPFKKTVLFAGRMDVDDGRKRVDHLIDIFRDVDGRDAGLVIVGSGMKKEWQERMNPKTTIYLGEVHDPKNIQISRVFKMADVCAIPGHVGLGLNQAFYFGLPVVTEEGNHPPEIGYLKHGRNGFIVPEHNLPQLREKLFKLLDDDELRREFSRNAHADILQNASIEGMYMGFRDCVRYITGTHRRPVNNRVQQAESPKTEKPEAV
jgi:glycosyltransferase involved in cell wall biosynthesis